MTTEKYRQQIEAIKTRISLIWETKEVRDAGERYESINLELLELEGQLQHDEQVDDYEARYLYAAIARAKAAAIAEHNDHCPIFMHG